MSHQLIYPPFWYFQLSILTCCPDLNHQELRIIGRIWFWTGRKIDLGSLRTFRYLKQPDSRWLQSIPILIYLIFSVEQSLSGQKKVIINSPLNGRRVLTLPRAKCPSQRQSQPESDDSWRWRRHPPQRLPFTTQEGERTDETRPQLTPIAGSRSAVSYFCWTISCFSPDHT